ncbi:MAG TPA: carbamoyltransferase C-terminal domain-containing protein [Bryobacteraceae bacterium]
MTHAYYGPEFSDREIRSALEAAGIAFESFENEADLLREAAARIARGSVTGWFQGRMEFGPRTLGNRSILADPRRVDMKDILNHRIKRREAFRPFCPSILAEAQPQYFTIGVPSPFMVQAYPFRDEVRGRIPAVVHEAGTGRLQTVTPRANPRYWGLLKEFEAITGIPVLVNTSFNENEPIVRNPADALSCFLRTDMDLLVLGNHMVSKPE